MEMYFGKRHILEECRPNTLINAMLHPNKGAVHELFLCDLYAANGKFLVLSKRALRKVDTRQRKFRKSYFELGS